MNQATSKVDFDEKIMKIDKFKLKKIVLGIVRGDQFLYIDSQICLQVRFLIATVFFSQLLYLFSMKGLLHYIVPFRRSSPSTC